MANTQEHTVKAFDQDIGQLRGLISQMGGLAESAIADAMIALQRGDAALAERIAADDKRIDAMETEVERTAVRIIALRAPMADDLREVVAALNRAAGYLRHEVDRRIELRVSPELRFEPDESFAEAERIEALLREAAPPADGTPRDDD